MAASPYSRKERRKGLKGEILVQALNGSLGVIIDLWFIWICFQKTKLVLSDFSRLLRVAPPQSAEPARSSTHEHNEFRIGFINIDDF